MRRFKLNNTESSTFSVVVSFPNFACKCLGVVSFLDVGDDKPDWSRAHVFFKLEVKFGHIANFGELTFAE